MKKHLQHYISLLFKQPYDGTQDRLANQLIYSQLKNRLVMMTQKPSTWRSIWKYSGVIPLVLIALITFSFRQKENIITSMSNITNEAAAIIGMDDNTEPPLFPGCDQVNEMEKADCSHKKMYEYVAQHLKYPEDMKAKKIEGKVYVKFVITNNGYVAEARVQKSLSPSADRAALDVVNGMNETVGKWTPGTKEGIPVTMDLVLPISFVLGTSPENKSGDGANSRVGTSENLDSIDNINLFYFEDVGETPEFPGGKEALNKFIAERIHYPKSAREQGISGQVNVAFIVTKDGDIKNAQVVRSLRGGCSEEALRVINEMPKWKPGRQDGRTVSVVMVWPVYFTLGTNQDKKMSDGESAAEKEPFSYVEEMPTFPNGQEAMYKFIYENIKYPDAARENGISGQVIVQFVVAKEGQITNAKIVRGIGGGCDEEALRVVNAMPKWKPGKHEGSAVAVSFTLPIKFLLQSQHSEVEKIIAPAVSEQSSFDETKVIAHSDPVKQEAEKTASGLHLSPNPAHDHIVIDLFEGAESIFIFAADGVQIAKLDVSKLSETRHRFDLSKFPAGQYTVQVGSAKETRSGQFAVIK